MRAMTYRLLPVILIAKLLYSAAPASAQQQPAYDPATAAAETTVPASLASTFPNALSVGTAGVIPPSGAAPTQPAYGQPPVAGQPPVVGAPIAGTPAAGPPAPPFVLNDIEQQFVQQTLQMWELESGKITTFNSDFERLDYDLTWGPGAQTPFVINQGTLSYSKPDKGSFKIDKISRWTKTDPQNTAADAPGSFVEQKEEVGEHWVCDGKAIYEYNHRERQLVVTSIPEGMRGTAIVDGPLPFLFGAEANKLMERYWIQPLQSSPEQITLKAYPRWQADAANYDAVDIILDRKTMQPMALQIHLPGGQQRHVYKFEADPDVNDKLDSWFGALFSSPRTPIGWKRVVVQASPATPGPQASNPTDGVQR
jgi:TIGR03009 family protein